MPLYPHPRGGSVHPGRRERPISLSHSTRKGLSTPVGTAVLYLIPASAQPQPDISFPSTATGPQSLRYKRVCKLAPDHVCVHTRWRRPSPAPPSPPVRRRRRDRRPPPCSSPPLRRHPDRRVSPLRRHRRNRRLSPSSSPPLRSHRRKRRRCHHRCQRYRLRRCPPPRLPLRRCRRTRRRHHLMNRSTT